MQRIPQIDPAKAPKAVAATLDAVKAKLGVVPNIFKTMAQSPAVLNGYLGFSGAIGSGKLPAALREQIALAVAGQNACDYCASAHTALGKMAGLTADEMKRNLTGLASDPKAQAAVTFAGRIVASRGLVSDAEVATVRAAGFSDEEIVEILGNVVANIFTNYFNHLTATDIDFPKVEARRAA
ncbi:MAG: carboxymuconolactone decarboxylase family protein [Hyphomicrobiaceae bacterium]